MIDTKKTSTPRPTVSWVPVRDARGRTHMEARWITPADRRAAHAA